MVTSTRARGRLEVPGALLAVFVFALHPVQVESVAWMTELKNTLSTVFFLASALVYLRFDQRRGRSMYVAGVAFGLLTAWFERTVLRAFGAEFDLSLAQRVLLAGRAVARLQPSSAAAHYQLAMVLAAKGRLSTALPEFEAAVQCDPSSPQLHYDFGAALANVRTVRRGGCGVQRGASATTRLPGRARDAAAHGRRARTLTRATGTRVGRARHDGCNRTLRSMNRLSYLVDR